MRRSVAGLDQLSIRTEPSIDSRKPPVPVSASLYWPVAEGVRVPLHRIEKSDSPSPGTAPPLTQFESTSASFRTSSGLPSSLRLVKYSASRAGRPVELNTLEGTILQTAPSSARLQPCS